MQKHHRNWKVFIHVSVFKNRLKFYLQKSFVYLCDIGEESAVEALIAQFYHWEGCAKIAEKKRMPFWMVKKMVMHPNSTNQMKNLLKKLSPNVYKFLTINTICIYCIVFSVAKSWNAHGIHILGFLYCNVNWFPNNG